MIRYILDTNICIELIRNRPADLVTRIASLDSSRTVLSSITLAELNVGVAKSSNPARNAEALLEFCTDFDLVPFDGRAAEVYGQVRAALEELGAPLGPLGTLIAAHALSSDATLVTNNDREFSRVAGLPVENWLTPS